MTKKFAVLHDRCKLFTHYHCYSNAFDKYYHSSATSIYFIFVYFLQGVAELSMNIGHAPEVMGFMANMPHAPSVAPINMRIGFAPAVAGFQVATAGQKL